MGTEAEFYAGHTRGSHAVRLLYNFRRERRVTLATDAQHGDPHLGNKLLAPPQPYLREQEATGSGVSATVPNIETALRTSNHI